MSVIRVGLTPAVSVDIPLRGLVASPARSYRLVASPASICTCPSNVMIHLTMQIHGVYQTVSMRKSQEVNYWKLFLLGRQVTNQRTTTKIA